MMMRRVLLGAALSAAVFAALPAQAQSPGQSPAKPYRIYMALWRGWEDAAQGFKDYFTNQNIPVELIIRDAGQDRAKLPEFVAEAKQLGVDLVFTWGTTVTVDMLGTYDKVDPAKHITDIPAVFAIVSQPVGAKVVPDLASSGRNIAGTSYLVPMDTQVNLLQSYRQVRKLGMVYNPLEKNSLVAADELRELGRKNGYELAVAAVDVVDGKPVVESIAGKVRDLKQDGVDFLYIPPDTFLNVNRDVLTGAALAEKMPSFAAAENPVLSSKAMFGGVYRYYTVGQLTAYKAEQILVHKKAPADLPIDPPRRLSIIINMPVVRALEFYPPMGLLSLAEVVDSGAEVRP
ncbi:conserved exported protein of unknown function [Magnetospirillum gryphiswaldense MSR-1 v2]|uniref:ABC transporter substrate-binding protein n=1 Tax=Magnetospirillum gryphiswaldense (strain DSM 6361 / JCM 21280 / NBRC 15271 / MSR-1) TaxID=431944 RepID=V6F7A7_MAGGM|nr:ABC transporter substrate-binding protein [Magnetospirillum gryphiswaldense]CDL01329.1 conserved exported protein of unknown function [Magnetospirillum gryphiswaldense MSR-1 v2]